VTGILRDEAEELFAADAEQNLARTAQSAGGRPLNDRHVQVGQRA
jgi:hypothetical protein